MPRSYLQHGRRHATGGTDPIPGLGGLNWAYVALTGTSHTAPLGNSQFGCTGSQFFTNDSSVFQIATNSDFTPIEGIQVLTAGHYIIFAQVGVDTFGAGAVDLTLSLAEGPSMFGAPYGMPELVTSTVSYEDGGLPTITVIQFAQVNGSSSGVPAAPIVWNINNGGANSATLIGGSYSVVQLDSDTTFI